MSVDQMSVARITDPTGTREVDLGPGEKIVSDLIFAIDKGESLSNAFLSATDATKDLDENQLRFLIPSLLSMVTNYARLWHFSMTRKHYEFLGQLLSLREMAVKCDPPVDLWPELEK